MKLSRIHSHLSKRSLFVIAVLLIGLSFLAAWFFQSKPSVEYQQTLLQRYTHQQQLDAMKSLKDTALLRKLVLHAETPEEFRSIHEKQYGLFVFAETISESQDLMFWNRQDILPPAANFEEPDGVYFRQLVNGYYIIHKSKLALHGMSSNLIVYALIPVLNQYYIETETSPTRFVHSEEAIKKIRIATSEVTPYPIRSIGGEVLFHVDQVVNNKANQEEPVTLILRLLALAVLLVYLHLFVESLRRKKGPVIALAWLVVMLTFCRVMLFLLPEMISLRQLPLFDPTVYASDSLNRSLGDLLMSASFLCWIVVYAWTSLGPIKNVPSFLRAKGLIAAGVVAIFVLIFTTFQLASLIYDLVANSKISFDVTNIFALNIYTAFGFLVLALLMLTFYYFSRLLFRFILRAFPNLFSLYLAVAIIGLLFLTLRTGDLVVLFYLPVLLWLVLYTLLLTQEKLIINRLGITVAGILFWLFVFSISLSVLIMQANHDREWRGRQAVAVKYDQLTDPTKERALSVALAFLSNDFLRNNFSRFYQEPQNSRLRDSFINTNSLGYANSYNTDFYVFDAANQPINNRSSRTYAELNNILEIQSRPTGGSADLYYYETSFDEFVYITRREIKDSSQQIGTLFIVSAPKHFETSSDLYPNLFRHDDQNNLEKSPIYSYAIYENGKLLKHSSKYGFATKLSTAEIPSAEFERRENGENSELWYKAGNKKIVVIAKKKDSFIESITLFSYLFCAFLFMVGILRAGAFLSRLAMDWQVTKLLSGLNIRTQIHGTIIFISVLSFLVIGAATISFFIIRYNRNNIDRLSRTATGAAEEMDQRVTDAKLIYNNVINFSDSLSANELRNVIREIAEVHGMIVNIYDLSGNLRVTSDEPIYQRGLLSTKMHPKAFYALNTQHKVQIVQNETINQWEYQSIYIAIRNTNGDTYAYLNVPSINTQLELKQEISNFIVTIINLNAFIFLIAGVIALFITNRITRSFSVIGDKMKAITLGKANEEIVWTRNDEIGELVTQYNKMVRQLEQSANALAKSEREGAWREMARQVAHEIKNPLTPMKLSIQYLQRAIQTEQPNVQQLTSNVASTLIEQIDHLSKIAADFSQFANIGNKKMEQVDLHSVIRSLVDLYASNPKMELHWNKVEEPLMLYADKTQLNRLFTNLLTNAVDACSEARACVVSIDEQKHDGQVVVAITDNGEGIPAEMQSKIFTPNFTTKTSGTGLGLAMCKSIVEQSSGSIWFETKEGEGTTFFVRLPLQK